ncbi:hypothetical protein AL542_17695 [Grimontia hollisae]|uniref:Uncharacterized protein n=2 Tax=Grimontia hollisae TaxID=673 RepID=D0IAX1_GRIHO|nr:hypothetical protein [Grimontia hollisae]AMG31988.1 hypothetical protein AL542_17695 [Grimontia hollisae]EEY71039.1 hypothetical protein VHA_002898 [Grimontia hollisae CIP 101886]MDF2184370.1 hypothetical protein [Grimontia hollisae]STO44226.1 Uncharacterised protein [Grimontia hollisae]STO57279.1 Uncharacterised protein [Grimontia hollisae]
MRRSALFLIAALVPGMSFAKDIGQLDTLCVSQKYHSYINASITWYENLVDLTIKKNPDLEGVASWFLEGRRNHFMLNQDAFDYYLENDPSKLNFDAPVESWLSLTQEDVKTLSSSNGELADAAKKVFEFRQGKAHEGNYDLRSALASLLSHPKEIDVPLKQYNDAMSKITETSCDKQ